MIITLYHLRFTIINGTRKCELLHHQVDRTRFTYVPVSEPGTRSDPLHYEVHQHYKDKLTRWPAGFRWDIFYEKPNQIDKLREEGWAAIRAELEVDYDRLAAQVILTSAVLTRWQGEPPKKTKKHC